MTKRIIALLLCAVMLIPCLVACASKKDEDDRGAYIVMYLSDEVYDFDPAKAGYNTETANILSMMFDTLFKLDENGKVKKSLVSKYTITKDDINNEYYMLLTLREGAYWSNGTALSSEDVVYTFKRLLSSNNSFAAASLLFDVKNARAVKEGDVSIDDLGVEAVESNVVKISFEGPIDYDQFILNLTNVATAPLLESYVDKDPDWAKKSSTMVTSGPFKLGKINYSDVTFDPIVMVADILANEMNVDLSSLGEKGVQASTDLLFDLSMTTADVYSVLERCEQRLHNMGFHVTIDVDIENRESENYQPISAVKDIASLLNSLTAVTDIHGTNDKGVAYAAPQTATVKVLNYFYLERNNYYMRDPDRDAIDEGVKPYRLLVDCSMSAEEILQAYKDGKLFYMGNIPLSIRGDATVKSNVKVTDALSTFVCYLNENAVIADGAEGTKLFADKTVRKALSQAIDRNAIAEAIVYAEAASALIPHGVFEGKSASKSDFRSVGGDILSKSADVNGAKKMLTDAGIDASKYSFSIKVAAYDAVHVKIVEMVQAAWSQLGFNVTVDYSYTIQNNDYFKGVGGITTDICDDMLIEALENNEYEVIALDYNAFSADAYSMLSNFALPFSGMALNIDTKENIYELMPNTTGYNSEAYNNLMEAIYYIPYFAELTAKLEDSETADDFSFLGLYESKAEYMAVYNAVKKIYQDNGITPTTKSAEWSKQRATLLHKAEAMLLEDMPIIPIVFNKNAVMGSSAVNKVKASYYAPCNFVDSTFKKYAEYTYLDKNGTPVSIFEEFPLIEWDKKGQDFTEEKETN
ncbi:MAG: hypothetical protein IJX62_02980 [Clostridia bacterium]|nr:hypothetical protein [Clostridia bacterium]